MMRGLMRDGARNATVGKADRVRLVRLLAEQKPIQRLVDS